MPTAKTPQGSIPSAQAAHPPQCPPASPLLATPEASRLVPVAVLLSISTDLSPERALDVVFVQDLGSHSLTSCRSGENASTSWPHWLEQKICIV
jgi:hypothetical protein